MSTSRKSITVTTGASSGIGATNADRLARRGNDLILVARSQTKLDEVAKRVGGPTGGAVNVIAANLNNKADLGRIETLFATDPGITMVVNNAGVGAPLRHCFPPQHSRQRPTQVTPLIRKERQCLKLQKLTGTKSAKPQRSPRMRAGQT